MNQTFRNYALINNVSQTALSSVLIASGIGDDALYYQAQIVKSDKDSFIVNFHRGSGFLERVRLFGSMKVRCRLHDNLEFTGELAFLENLCDGNVATVGLSLTMLDYDHIDTCMDQRMVPLT